MNDSIKRRGAEAALATYLQMARATELARQVQARRERGLWQRRERVTDAAERMLIRQQMDAQRTQAATIEGEASRFAQTASDIAHFAREGLNADDFERLGLAGVVGAEQIDSALAEADPLDVPSGSSGR